MSDQETRPARDCRGERCSRAILTEEQVREILTFPKSYGYRKILACKYGVTVATITAIRCRKSWRHVNV